MNLILVTDEINDLVIERTCDDSIVYYIYNKDSKY